MSGRIIGFAAARILVFIMTENEALKKTEQISSKVMQLSVAALLLNMRFFARAVNRLPYFRSGKGYTCDGRRLTYEPELVLQRYKKSDRLPVHDYLHMLLHCVFRHWKVGETVNERAWNTSCDIAVEAVIARIAPSFTDKENAAERAKIFHEMELKYKPLTAEKIYSYFVRNGTSDDLLNTYSSLFGVDDHTVWYKNRHREYEPEEKVDTFNIGYPDDEHKRQNDDDNDRLGEQGELSAEGKSDSNDGSDSSNGSEESEDKNSDRTESDENGKGQSGDDSDQDPTLEDWLQQSMAEQTQKLESMWREISEQIESDLNSFSKNKGDESKYLTSIIKDINRDRYDYSAFLRRFSVSGEIMKSDIDSFDINFYSYGLGLYGHVALIEPLEHKETRLVRDFVIAIDTSGSVSGAVVKGFINKTYSILKSEESFFKKVNIYIIQCDTEVRDAVKLTDSAEFEKYIENFEVKGLGGTDFRPVFEQVDELIQKGEFNSLKGLIYFTDGFGTFPDHKPGYETAFAFLRNDYESNEPPDIPPWAIKLILEEDDILNDQ